MSEVKTLVFGDSFEYKGLMNVKSLCKLIDKWFKDKGYEKQELWNFEEVYETGKQITLKLQPYKKVSDYAQIEIRLSILLKKCQDVTIEKDGVKLKLKKGEGTFTFDVFLETDYEHYWATKPIYFFLKTIADKYVYKNYLDRYEEIAVKDKEELKREIKSFLNMERYT